MAGKIKARRDPLPLARTLVTTLWVYLATEVLLIVGTLLEIRLLGSMSLDQPASLLDDLPLSVAENLIVGLSSVINLLVFMIAAFLVLKWIYRVNLNAGLIARDKEVSAGWAVGWYFVPFANLYMPFKAMRETWQISHSPEWWRSTPTPALLHWWWGLLLASSIIGNMSGRAAFRAKTVQDLLISDLTLMFASGLTIPLILVLIRLVRRLSEVQSEALKLDVFGEAERPAPLVVSA